MKIDYDFIMLQMKRLYMENPLREITTGHSGDSIFEVEVALRQHILRVSEFSEKKQAHTEFETSWVDYLAAQIDWLLEPNSQRQWYWDWHKDRIKNNISYAFIDYEKILGSIPEVPLK